MITRLLQFFGLMKPLQIYADDMKSVMDYHRRLQRCAPLSVESEIVSKAKHALLLNADTDGRVVVRNIEVNGWRGPNQDEYYPIVNRADYYAKKYEAQQN